MEKVSIIVPIYNAEKYLKRCIDSLVEQTYKNIEIILIDDGSKDNSYSICDNYVKVDDRIKCVHQENKGLSYARNKGLEMATGEYIMFIDSDDYYEKNAVELMINDISDSYELVVAKYNVVRDGVIEEIVGAEISGICSCKMYMKMAFEPETDFYFGVVWNKVYFRNIIEKNKLCFNNDVTLCEDLCFNMEYLKYVNNVRIVDAVVNNYEQGNPVSEIKRKRPRGDYWKCKKYVNDVYIDLYTLKGVYEKYKKNIANHFMIAIVQEIKEIIEYDRTGKTKKEVLNAIENFCSDKGVYLAANECDIERRLEKITAKYIKLKKYKKIVSLYKLKAFLKNNMKFLHDFVKKKNNNKFRLATIR